MIPIDSAAASGRYQKHCPGCFQLKEGAAVCPHCGYDESTPRSPLFLPHGMILGGQYRVGRVLGRPGGFGITYLGWDINLQQRVAIKEYLPRELAARTQAMLDVCAHTPEDRRGFEFGKEQFLREARIVAKLDHPNIVRVRNFFNAHSTAYLVMDYYEGMSLGDYLTNVRTRLEPELAIPLVKPILDGLQYVHERGLVHRDLKPHNIYLAAVGRPIVLDFGAARQAAGDRVQSLSVVLTEGYAPLEQYQRRAIQGPWTDVYGVAATLYRMIAGHAPPIALDRIGQDPVETDGWEAVPEGLIPAMRKALAVRPSDRYQSALEFRTALEQYRSVGSPIPAEVTPARGRRETDPVSKPRVGTLPPKPRSNTLPPMTPVSAERPPVPLSPISSRVPVDAPLMSPVVLRATAPPSTPTAPPVSVPVANPEAEREDAMPPRPAGGYPLLNLPPGAVAATPRPAEAPVPPPGQPLYRRVEEAGAPPVPMSRPSPQALRRRAVDRKGTLQRRGLLLALLLVASGAVVYVLLNPPGETPVPPQVSPAAAGEPAAATPATPDPLPVAGVPPPSPPVDAEPLLPGEPPETVVLPSGELPVAGSEGLLAMRSFRVGVTEVTVGQFRDFVRRSGYRNPRWQNYPCESAGGRLPEWDNPGYAQTEDFPVVCVSWADANAYSQWLSRETGLRYRLPTEAEWEYAARAGTRGRYWWGNEVTAGVAACQNCLPEVPTQPAAVRSFPGNPFGLYETLGNAREWTCSSYQSAGVSNRCGTPGEDSRVAVRGGSWQQGQEALDISSREGFEPYRRNVWTGFRVVQDLPGG
ncbi:MAG: SUMF1/EgtB/PvdO family nonheme iron enzyme [Stagnimonas sp.]|nr:SUMF1/EgtB/PvdO family nonheme iron enzyme [Stagnimonas sp.]